MVHKRDFEYFRITRLSKVRNFAFDPPSCVRTGSKARFRTVWKWIKSEFSNKSRHVTIKFEEKLGWIKSEMACICFTWLPPSHSKLDQKLDPRVVSHSTSKYFFTYRKQLNIFVIKVTDQSLFENLETFWMIRNQSVNYWINKSKWQNRIFLWIKV